MGELLHNRCVYEDPDDDSLWGRPGTWVAMLAGLIFLALSVWFGCYAYTKWGPEAFWSGLGKFATSPGFGGSMAVVAAAVAFVGVRSTTRSSRRIARADRRQSFITSQQDHWWGQAKWALDLVVQEEGKSQPVGYAALQTLLQVDSRFRPVGAAEMVQAVTSLSLALPDADIEKVLEHFESGAVDHDAGAGDNPEKEGRSDGRS